MSYVKYEYVDAEWSCFIVCCKCPVDIKHLMGQPLRFDEAESKCGKTLVVMIAFVSQCFIVQCL